MNKWFLASEPPKSNGYYLTVHYVESMKQHLWKAFWFDTTKGEWKFRYKPDVKIWYDKRFDFYVPCQHQENVEPLSAKFIELIKDPEV